MCFYSFINELSFLFCRKDVGMVLYQESKDDFHPVLTRSIDVFDLSVRAKDALKAQAIHYIGDLIVKTETDLTRVSHLKKEDINIIKAFLSKNRFAFRNGY